MIFKSAHQQPSEAIYPAGPPVALHSASCHVHVPAHAHIMCACSCALSGRVNSVFPSTSRRSRADRKRCLRILYAAGRQTLRFPLFWVSLLPLVDLSRLLAISSSGSPFDSLLSGDDGNEGPAREEVCERRRSSYGRSVGIEDRRAHTRHTRSTWAASIAESPAQMTCRLLPGLSPSLLRPQPSCQVLRTRGSINARLACR